MCTPEEQPLNIKVTPKKKTFKEKIVEIKENITVEPVLACYVVPRMISRLASQTLSLDKACRVNLQYDEMVCDALNAGEGTNYLKEEFAVQELVAGMETWKSVLLTAMPIFLILFLGAWSDRTGKRKLCILLPIIGDLLMCLSDIVNVYYFYELPVEVKIFFEGFFPGIMGGWITTHMGAFAYISDVTSEESRTFRIGIVTLCLTAGRPIGTFLSGILLELTGYYGAYTICSLLYIFSISYGFIYIRDSERPITKIQNGPSNVRGFLKSFFDIKHVKDTVTVALKKGPNHRRIKSILILASVAFVYGPFHGEETVRYLFTRYRFNWDALMYSYYSTFFICIHLLGALISITVFSRRLKWDDSVLGIISSGSKVVGTLYTAFARNTTDMYIAVAIEMFNATSNTAMISICSKLVTSDELGKMTSNFSLMEVITSMVSGVVYSWIYMVTLDIDAGFVFYVSTALTIPPLLFFTWLFMQHRKDLTRSKTEVDEYMNTTEFGTKKKNDPLINTTDLEHEANIEG